MRAAGNAWISVVVLVAGIALLPGLLYLLGLALAGGRAETGRPAAQGDGAWRRGTPPGEPPVKTSAFCAGVFSKGRG